MILNTYYNLHDTLKEMNPKLWEELRHYCLTNKVVHHPVSTIEAASKLCLAGHKYRMQVLGTYVDVICWAIENKWLNAHLPVKWARALWKNERVCTLFQDDAVLYHVSDPVIYRAGTTFYVTVSSERSGVAAHATDEQGEPLDIMPVAVVRGSISHADALFQLGMIII